MPRQVLIVDDDFDIRELLCEYFRGRGWEAMGVSTVADGIRALEGPVDGLIVDQRLPDRDGSALVREAAGRGFAVVAITAFPTIDEVVELMSAGACTLLQKPFRLKEVLERLEAGIRQRAAEAEQRRRLRALELLERLTMAEEREQLYAIEADFQGVLPLTESWERALTQARRRLGA